MHMQIEVEKQTINISISKVLINWIILTNNSV